VLPENTNQDEHQLQCVMFTTCNGCNNCIEVRVLTNHKLTSCTNKDNFIMCKICKEAINKDEYDNHQKIGKCNPAKNPNSSNRCPLCHKDIMPTDKGFYVHLVEEGCEERKK
jgi:centrosomal protein CEP104